MPIDPLEAQMWLRFVERRDVKAIQYGDAYSPARAWNPATQKYDGELLPFKLQDMADHLAGRRTYGHYLVSKENRCRLFAYDIDFAKTGFWKDDHDVVHEFNPRAAWQDPAHPAREQLTIQLRCMAEGLAIRAMTELEIPVAVAYSGHKGMHVYGFTGSEESVVVRDLAIDFLKSWGCFVPLRGKNFFRHELSDPDNPMVGYPNLEIEVFPKQDDLEDKEFGNLMRLPLGIHQKSKQPGFFVDVCCGYNILRPADPLEALATGDPWHRDKAAAPAFGAPST